LIGAAAGAALTYYLLSRRGPGNRITDAAQDLTGTVEKEAGKVSSAVTGAVEDATKAVKEAASKVAK
jgi:hypothetical protein